ncbi:MAG: hypothetical protein ACPGYT_14835 [Nitrospirales bacterium]
MNSPKVNVPEELVREVFAHFGRAYYFTDCLHRQLANMRAVKVFSQPEDVLRTRIEEELKRSFEMTLGQLFQVTRDVIDNCHHARLETAVAKRNFLAHHFWFERSHLMFSEAGLQEMIGELNTLAEEFHSLDEVITSEFGPAQERFGITEEVATSALNEIMAGKPVEALPRQRYLRKQERVVRVWKNGRPDQAQFLFETDDGELWQLSENGFGWATYADTSSEWIEFSELQVHLPVVINPRPKVTSAWNYQLEFGRSVSFQVRKDGKT